MGGVLSRIMAFFCCKKIPQEEEKPQELHFVEVDSKLKTLEGMVSKIADDHGFINDVIYFTNDVVTSKVPLEVGQRVTAVVKEDETTPGLKAIRVDALPDNADGNEPSNSKVRILFGCVIPEMESGGFVNHLAYFSFDVVCKDFMPYEGDWIEAEFSIQPGTQNRKAVSVKPLKHKHIYEARITSISGRHGMIDDDIFFTLDSLELPDGYVPNVSDVVNTVAVRSTYLGYGWRALSITPVHQA